jgi:hypothetical protein
MPWLRMDDNMLTDPQWIDALEKGGSPAVHLYLDLCLYSIRHLTDGVISAHVLRAMPGPRGRKVWAKAYRALIDASLLTQREDGSIEIVGHLERNPSRDDVLKKRSRWAQAQRKHRAAEDVIDDDGRFSVDDSRTPSSGRHGVPSPPLPLPIPSPGNREIRASGSLAPINADSIPVTWHSLDGWDEPNTLEGEAVMAGVPREFYRAQLESLRNTTIGGKGGVRDRTRYVRGLFPQWKIWAETDRHKRTDQRKDRPNQPDCGLTGLEMFDASGGVR